MAAMTKDKFAMAAPATMITLRKDMIDDSGDNTAQHQGIRQWCEEAPWAVPVLATKRIRAGKPGNMQ